MKWKLFAAMAVLLGGTSLASCDSDETSGKCNEGREIVNGVCECINDSNHDGVCEEEEFQEEDVFQSEEDTTGGIEDTVQPYVPPANCMICDEFSDPEYTEANWNITSKEMPPLITGSYYEVSNGLLSSSHYLFDSINTFDMNIDSIFEIRCRLLNPNSALTVSFYSSSAPEYDGIQIVANESGSGEIRLKELSDSQPIGINTWHKFRFDLTDERLRLSLDDQPPFMDMPKLNLGDMGLRVYTQDDVEIDYVAVVKPQ